MGEAKKLKLGSAIAVVVGCVIGSGVFVKPGRVLELAGSSNYALLAWILGGVMTLAGGLTVAEVAFRIPKTGGVYSFIEAIYGERLGFVAGWVNALIYGPGVLAGSALFFGALVCQFLSLPASMTTTIALPTLIFLAVVSALGTSYASMIQNITTMIKLLPVFVIGLCGLIFGAEPVFNVEVTGVQTISLSAAILSTLWAYDGWLAVANIAGEIETPSKNMPRAIIIGLTLTMVCYILVNLSLFHILDKDLIVQLNENAGGAAAIALFGPVAGKILSFCILVSIFGCLNGHMLTVTRIPYAMAKDGLFPCKNIFSRIHPTFQTPFYSITLVASLAAICIVAFNAHRIGEIAIFSMYVFYGFIFLGIFKIRRIFGVPEKGNYKIPLYPFVPIAAFFGVLFICCGMFQERPWDAVISLGIAAISFPIYYALRKN